MLSRILIINCVVGKLRATFNFFLIYIMACGLTKHAGGRRRRRRRRTKRRKSRRRMPWAGWARVAPGTHARTVMLRKCGRKCFLGPKKSFPVCAKGTCKVNSKGLYAAYVRARQWGKPRRTYRGKTRPRHSRKTYQRIAKKARRMLAKRGKLRRTRRRGGNALKKWWKKRSAGQKGLMAALAAPVAAPVAAVAGGAEYEHAQKGGRPRGPVGTPKKLWKNATPAERGLLTAAATDPVLGLGVYAFSKKKSKRRRRRRRRRR